MEETIVFKRKIEKDLEKWKNNLKNDKKGFLLKGLRQTGKTTIIKDFAYKNFENVIYLNFKTDKDLFECFEGDLEADTIITKLSAKRIKNKFIPYKTVLIFDEVQECNGARYSIKPFMEDGKYDIIASGSMLGIKGYNKKYQGGVPVGFENIVYMKSMDFEEFLWAIGFKEEILENIKKSYLENKEIDKFFHELLLEYFRLYICVGGMPAVVKKYIKTKNYRDVRKEQLGILESFKDDFAKHLNKDGEEEVNQSLLSRINAVYDSIPSQLGKENKKFVFSKLHKKATFNEYESAINWLKDYGLIEYCYNLSCLESPLNGNVYYDKFKIYVQDSGLFIAMLDDDTMDNILNNRLGIYKGAIYENIVADAFIKNQIPLYYFSKDSGLEVDFIMKYKGNITLIEVKARSGNTKSSKTILNDNAKYKEVNNLIKIGSYNIEKTNNIMTIPYYLTFMVKND